ncbi:MAG: imidazole glycerol phosphate synthase cyclase subunit [Pseudomonadota bacterium]|nr:imidazole glycerol phosphate synthase cyclase subunit [Pseudomonadota bacterium]MEC7465023.1 imidazole glycerol phosphate synthase cyclase subunit [Pseudomonadota bacterium]MEC7786978.1 imidazole glycerol phosphate synthase cyclase subunit [Pseudomonadota bacterium]MEC8107885.1 imidazole glycerol phosphate synthase cyclase subunit [Pseudomonadota bacterium]MEC8168929.1 imidazole glycerol phosphate synthase cyclase subunit [Pseudomonadota bacterium]
MLKKRIIPVLLLKDKRMVKGKKFKDFKDTGEPKTAVRIYSAQDADELVFLDIDNNSSSLGNLIEIVKQASEECFMPLAAGGGISDINQARELLKAGADKIVVNTSCVKNPSLIKEISEEFGEQCVIGSIDYKISNNLREVWIKSGKLNTNLDPLEHAKNLIKLGAGEILLNSIDRDGMMEGYDLEYADKVSREINVPLIVCGGAGNYMHLADLLNNTSISAAACASLFHFGDNNPIRARSYLKNLDIPMRMLK